MNKFRPDYLEALATYIEKLPKAEFNMAAWVKVKNAGRWDLEADTIKRMTKAPISAKLFKSCGTVGCALGHAPAVPVLKRAGLKLGINSYERNSLEPKYKGLAGFKVAEALFGIPAKVAEFLFYPSSYDIDEPTRKQVATRLRFVAQDPFGANKVANG